MICPFCKESYEAINVHVLEHHSMKEFKNFYKMQKEKQNANDRGKVLASKKIK